jgi:hypothetical protein
MKRFAFPYAVIAIAVALAVPAFAQEVPSDVVGTVKLGNTTLVFVRGTAGLNLDELRAFDKVISDDPAVAKQLAKNPKLVANHSFLTEHPVLGEFLAKYPGGRDEIQENPGNFVTPVKGSTWTHAS